MSEDNIINLDAPISQTKFAELVGVSQQAVSKRESDGTLTKGQPLNVWLQNYCQKLRDEASGRAGDNDKRLTEARIQESEIKTAQLRLAYNRDIGNVIYTEDAAGVISEWARFANREYIQTLHRLVSEIQTSNNITIDQDLVDNLVSPATERIKDFAAELGRSLVDSIEPVHQAEGGADSQVAV